MSLIIRVLFIIYYFFIFVISGYLLIFHWRLNDLQSIIQDHPAIRYVLLAGLFGLMGSSVHGITSFTVWAGRSNLGKSWGWWYFMHPPTGAILAVIVYFVIRAGLVSGSNDLSYYGTAAIGAIVGLSTKKTTEKLKTILDSIFGNKEEEKKGKPDDSK